MSTSNDGNYRKYDQHENTGSGHCHFPHIPVFHRKITCDWNFYCDTSIITTAPFIVRGLLIEHRQINSRLIVIIRELQLQCSCIKLNMTSS